MITTKASVSSAVSDREKKNRQLAREAASEGIVLLENNGVLPLSPCPAALFGAGAGFTIKGGSGSGEVNVRHDVNVLEGLENAGFTITSKDWISRYAKTWQSGKEEFIKAQRKKLLKLNTAVLAELMAAEYRYPSGDRLSRNDLSGTDTCIYVLSRQSGEGYDRKDEAGSFRFDETEEHNIRFCAEHFRRFILVINTGAPVDLTPLDSISGIGAVVYMGQPGMEGGNALADILTGRKSPSGKLAVTWPEKYKDVPFSDEYSISKGINAAYKEGIYVGYRYYDSFCVKPRYPFGYGKSYTAFDVSVAEAAAEGTDIRISASVTNAGAVSGKEVLQLYVSCPQGSRPKELQRLCAFEKTKELAPGESEILTLSFPVSSLSGYDESSAETYLEQGDYLIRLGTSSRDTCPAAVLHLSRHIVLSKHQNLCPSDHTVSKLRHSLKETVLPEGLPVLNIPESLFEAPASFSLPQETVPADVRQYISGFGPKDMIRFCAGTGLFGEKKGFCVPGAVGHTTTGYISRGIPNIELCDGPAGLRIQRRSTLTKNGKIKAVDTSISLYEFLPPVIKKFLLGNPDKEQVLFQYVTGFPVAAVTAQTWNKDMAYRIGQAVGTEMEEYGVSVWLAPALNIVRNPLCGRNYEYYSEDPLISGKMASAIIRGVQETPGRHVTVKHFAVNNQEENRYYVSSDLDERALREIYLRGFETAVKEGHPHAVMTAYNKINGIYCAENKDLCTGILRGEWSFDGIVMTDWLSTGENRADEAKAIEAGVDLIMPGGNKTLKALRTALKENRLSQESVRKACIRVLKLILNRYNLQ
ncbi:MAG: glycoside hydrolase family 3 C-terminal domain-containing protein [Solobacterium sp.]|nr:glycoside hydrolase family 3 C-terminal domain-containing protein [Solobacterium sp.]